MTNEVINKMINEVNNWINLLKIEYEKYGRSEWYTITYNRVLGMITMLTIATGKEYYFDNNGLHER